MYTVLRQQHSTSPPAMATLSPPSPSEGSSSPSASRGGKSGKFIEQLQSQLSACRLELNSAKAQKDEAVRNWRAVQAKVGGLESQMDTYKNISEHLEHKLASRDAQIAELNKMHKYEVKRRAEAERRESEMSVELGTTQSRCHEAVAKAQEVADREKANAAVLLEALRAEKQRHRTAEQKAEAVLHTQSKRIHEASTNMKKLEVTIEMKAAETEKQQVTVKKMALLQEEYCQLTQKAQEELDKGSSHLRTRLQDFQEKADEVLQETKMARDEMRWARNLFLLEVEPKTNSDNE